MKEEFEWIVIMPLAVFTRIGHLSVRRPKQPVWQEWLNDPWLIATFVVACIASITSCWYFFQQHQLLLYGDAISHLRIARRVFDNTPPGFAQLGGVWLPLPHLLMLPFVWNYYLWRTGLAGSFPSMFCYLVAVVYLFFSARRLTQDSRASFVGTLLFILNPNILYVQSTPLSEAVCIATTVMTCYYFLAWTQDNHPKHLVGVAAGTFLATLSRYDGWGLYVAILVLIVVVGLIKRHRWVQIGGHLLVFGTLGALGIGLWFLWCQVIFGDPLYFHHYVFGASSAETDYYGYHNIWRSILDYMLPSIRTVGPILFVLAFIGFIVFAVQLLQVPNTFGAVAFLTPFVFYILTFYTGQDTIILPGIGGDNTPQSLWNVRFATEGVPSMALFLSVLVPHWGITRLAHLWSVIGSMVLVIAICIQTTLIAYGGIISLQDGMYGYACKPTGHITIYLVQHYASGRILEDVNAYLFNEADIGIQLRDAIYEGSGQMWKKALADPVSVVDWIIVPLDRTEDDPIASYINLKSPAFLSQFTLVVQQADGIALFHRNGGPLTTRTIPPSLTTDHRLCRPYI